MMCSGARRWVGGIQIPCFTSRVIQHCEKFGFLSGGEFVNRPSASQLLKEHFSSRRESEDQCVLTLCTAQSASLPGDLHLYTVKSLSHA